MRLVCPCCGAVASLEAWVKDVHVRRFFSIYVQFPVGIQERLPDYLGLFRSVKTGDHPAALSWRRAVRILEQLKELIGAGTVQWDRGEVRPAPPQLWAEAIERVLERRPRGLKNHNYLRHVAWELAAPLAAKAEQEVKPREVPAQEPSEIRYPSPDEAHRKYKFWKRQAATSYKGPEMLGNIIDKVLPREKQEGKR